MQREIEQITPVSAINSNYLKDVIFYIVALDAKLFLKKDVYTAR